MIVTKKQCQEFKSNPSVNPLTGRSIHIGKITHQNLLKACNDTPKKVESPKNYKIPPMGPMIHWDYNADDLKEKANNFIKFFNYIDKRIGEILEEKLVSEMELNEIIGILKEGKERFDDKSHLDIVEELFDDIKSIKKSRKIIHDLPKETVVNLMHVRSNRLSIRANIVWIYGLYEEAISTMKAALQNRKIITMWDSGHIKNILSDKVYLDYVIKHRIFTYDDIYKNTFPSEKAFEELQKTYKEWVKLYKDIKGKSPRVR
jgi:hypothetical protein